MKKTVQIIIRITFVIYCLVLFRLLFLELRTPIFNEEITLNIKGFNLVPFSSMAEYIEKAAEGKISVETAVFNIGGNLIAFFPMGCYLPCLFKPFKKILPFALIVLCLLIAVETVQLILRIGIWDIDDIILNYSGAMLGFATVNISKIKAFLKATHIFL